MRQLVLLIVIAMIGALPVLAQTTVVGTVTLSANATDTTSTVGDTECGVDWVQFMLGSNPISNHITTPSSGTTYTASWDSKTVANGNYVLTARASDKAGTTGACDSSKPNMGTSSPMNITVNNPLPPDTTPPTVTIGPPTQGAVITDKRQDIQVAATDPEGISRIQLFIQGVLKATTNNVMSLYYNWNTSPYKHVNTVTISATATDKAGTIGSTNMTVSVR